MIHGDGYSSEDCRVLRNYGAKYKRQTSSLGGKTAINKHVKFNNKTEVNGEELNTMVKKSAMAALEGEKKRKTPAWLQQASEYLAMRMRILELALLT